MAAGLAAGLLAGCGTSDIAQIAATAERTAGEQFKRAGVELAGGLDCASAGGANEVTLTCTGATKAGRPVTVSGVLDRGKIDNEHLGDRITGGRVVGKVDSTIVFHTDCLGCAS